MTIQKIMLLDDNLLFASILRTIASHQGIDVEHCKSTRHLSAFSECGADVILLDYWLGHANGVMLAKLDPFFKTEVPIVLISENKFLKGKNSKKDWPQNIVNFVPKSAGIDVVLAAAKQAYENNMKVRLKKEVEKEMRQAAA